MKPWIWLRIAAVLQGLGTVGHNLETLSTKPTHGSQEQAVFDAMRGLQFDIMGSMRSTWDFYRGYQFFTTVNFLLLVVLFWLLSNLCRTAPKQALPFVIALLIAQIAATSLSWMFFFAGPGVMGGLIAVCLAIAATGLYRVQRPAPGAEQPASSRMIKQQLVQEGADHGS